MAVSTQPGATTRPRRRPFCIATLIIALMTGLLATALTSTAGATTTIGTARPLVKSCTPLQEFVKSSKSKAFYGTGATAWVYNYNTTGLSKTLETSTTNTIGFSLDASQSVDAGVIFASADASFSEGVTYDHDDSSTQSTTVYDIPIGEYGIIQIGNQMGVVKGTYEVVNSTCVVTQKTKVTGIFPLDQPAGTAGGYNTTAKPPWPQSAVVSS